MPADEDTDEWEAESFVRSSASGYSACVRLRRRPSVRFFLDGKRWSAKRVSYSPDVDDTLVVTEARLGELDLAVEQTFLYLFDFGDHWEFTVTVEDVQLIDTRKAKPQVIESKGDSPEQIQLL